MFLNFHLYLVIMSFGLFLGAVLSWIIYSKFFNRFLNWRITFMAIINVQYLIYCFNKNHKWLKHKNQEKILDSMYIY